MSNLSMSTQPFYGCSQFSLKTLSVKIINREYFLTHFMRLKPHKENRGKNKDYLICEYKFKNKKQKTK